MSEPQRISTVKSDEAVAAARKALHAGTMGDAWARKNGQVTRAVPIESPRGELRAWFVPVLYGGRLLGFFELALDLAPRRYSSFQRQEGKTVTCPPAADWLDPATIVRRASSLLRVGETPGSPYLSYDTHLSRLAWAVPMTSPARHERLVFVVGETVFDGSSPGEATSGAGLEG